MFDLADLASARAKVAALSRSHAVEANANKTHSVEFEAMNATLENDSEWMTLKINIMSGEPTPYVCRYVSMVCGMYVGMYWVFLDFGGVIPR